MKKLLGGLFLWAGSVWGQFTSYPASGGSSTGGWFYLVDAAKCQNTIAGTPFDLPSSNTPTATCATSNVTNTTSWATLDWNDTGTKTAYLRVLLPTASLGTVIVDIGGSTDSTSTSTVSFRVYTSCVTGAPDPSYNSAQTVTFTPSGTSENLATATLSSLTLTGCSAGNVLRLKFDRDTSDSNTATFKLWYVRLRQ